MGLADLKGTTDDVESGAGGVVLEREQGKRRKRALVLRHARANVTGGERFDLRR